MTLYFFELKQNLKATLIWMAALVGVNAMFLSVFPYYKSEMEVLKPLFSGFPPQLLEAFGINVESLFTALGFFSFIQMYVQLMAAMQGMVFGLGILGREVRLKTADFLFTKPVKRSSIYIQKLLAIFTLLIATWLVYSLFSWLVLSSYEAGTFNFELYVWLEASSLFITLFFASMGMLMATLLRKLKSVVSISISFVFAFFVLNMMQGILDEPWVRYLSPFQYFERSYIFLHQSYETPLFALCVGLTLSALLAAYLVLTRKDIHAV